MKDEIIAGLKNAIERGETLEHAMRTFVNSGYNLHEVRLAGKELSSGVSDIIYSVPNNVKKHEMKLPLVRGGSTTQALVERGRTKRITLIIMILLVLLVFIGALSYLIYTLL